MKKIAKYLSVGVVAILISACGGEKMPEHVLPFLGTKDLDYKMVDGVEVVDTLYHTVVDFKYLNQGLCYDHLGEYERKGLDLRFLLYTLSYYLSTDDFTDEASQWITK